MQWTALWERAVFDGEPSEPNIALLCAQRTISFQGTGKFKKGDRHARVEKPIAREMVLQISHCVQPKVPKEGDVRKFEKGGREDPPGAVQPTVGLDEAVIRDYIRNQEEEEKHQEQQNLRGL